MIQEHFRLLETIVERGIAGQVEIHYNTNGTQFPEQAENIWQHFKTVEIAFSIDDLGERFEYQRTNAVWSEVEHNIARFDAMRSRNPNIQLQACITVNIFNIYYIADVARWAAQQNFNFVYWNMMHDAWYFSIATLPESAKAAITQHLKAQEIPAVYQLEFDRICDFMNRGASTDGSILKMKIRDLDYKRNQDLRNVAPEFAALIDYKL